jgi:AcrR family transcriptional regulator
MSSAAGRRARKAAESRDRILECAARLFAKQGYDRTSMDDIGECADVSRATVFNYFPRKEDLVLAWFTARRIGIAEILADSGAGSGDAPARLRRAFRALGRIFEDDPRTGRGMVRAWLQAGGALLTPDSDTSRLFAETIRAGQAEGELACDIDATRAGEILFDAYQGALIRWVTAKSGTTDLEKQLLATVDTLLEGIGNARSRRSRSK